MKTTQQLIFIFVTFLILGCEEDITGTQSDDGHGDKVYGSIHGIVTDYNSNALLQGIIVNWVSNGVTDSTLTDENGYYSITDLIPGDYNLIFSGEDTTLAVQYAVIEEEEIVINMLTDLVAGGQYEIEPSGDYYVEVVKDVEMYSMNGDATGYVYLKVDEELTTVGASVTVIAEYTQNIKPSQYTATTDAEGNYTFSNIPAAGVVKFKTVQFTNDTYTFDEDSANKSLIPKRSVTVDPITMNISAPEPVLLSNNFGNNDFQIGDSPTGTFNEAINWEDYNFEMDLNNQSHDFEITWSADRKTFTINPGEDLHLAETYTISIDGYTVAGYKFDESYTFETQIGIEEESSSLESYDNSGNLIGKNDDITWTFSESLDATKFPFTVHEPRCNNPDYTTQNTCLCGNNTDNGGFGSGVWNVTSNFCSGGADTGNNWTGYTHDIYGYLNEEDCNIIVTQWDNDIDQTITDCYFPSVNSVTNTVTLTAPTGGWGKMQVIGENGVFTTTYPDITVEYKYASTLTTYDILPNTFTIKIVD